ncbi:MAG: 1-hydroxycarotenoid 3,4-desaturase CrtD [Pseudomonadota bacterium]
MANRITIVGAGIGGLAAAMRLSAAGCDVAVIERHSAPGGKMRTVPSVAGPVDAGPTVMTMRPVFEELFQACGTDLSTHITLEPLDILARHYWPDGSSLDLFANWKRSEAAIHSFAGAQAAMEFARFHATAQRLYQAFEAPMMQAPSPTLAGLTATIARNPSLIPAMAPGRSLATSLAAQFTDPRLQQLFGRYATYVGGSPTASPALLSLIWHAESRGVWAVQGGMHKLAQAMRTVAESHGATFHFDTKITEVETKSGNVTAIHTATVRLPTDAVVFNGDPRALQTGLLGHAVAKTISSKAVAPRSLSAFVWSFAATPTALQPEHHNVFFARSPNSEFAEIAENRLPTDPTLYVCAQDRGAGAQPTGPERFEIILNGPPRPGTQPDPQETIQCQKTTFETLARMGLTFDETPPTTSLATPETFNDLFPATNGSLYGRSPHGMMAAFHRPRARTAIQGLYLCGGGAHPGAGIPMATLSGKHAAEAILQDLASTSTSRRTATAGGMSTASRTMAATPSRSSPS